MHALWLSLYLHITGATVPPQPPRERYYIVCKMGKCPSGPSWKPKGGG